MKVYLDNCCYNRPYDNQEYLRIRLEAQAKLHIQQLIVDKKLELTFSYMSVYENEQNPFEIRKNNIRNFFKNASYYVGAEHDVEVRKLAKEIESTGVKFKDSYHVAAAIFSGTDYFITTDDRVLKYKCDKICIISPTEFIRELEV